ncbi:MAG: ABC transporter ATP-binding protein [Verrucomicrobiota bacterium]
MSNAETVIRVENLGKRYRIGRHIEKPKSMGEKVGRAMTAPFKYVRDRLRKPGEDEILWALKEVNFEVKRGEVLGIVGKNGAGKSTLLKLLSRITDPTEGTALIKGRVNSLLEVGTGFHDELTGRENVYLNAALHGLRKTEIDRKFDEIIAFSGIGKFVETPVKRFSSGMRVRLGFAVAAHLEPDLLIVDEVLAVGDADFQHKCILKMEEIKRSGTTILFVSHNMFSVRSLCTRAMLLVDGQKVMDDEAGKVIDEYFLTNAETMGATQTDDGTERKGSGEVRIQSIDVLDHQDNPRPELYYRDPPLFVRMAVETHEAVTDAVITLHVALRDGSPVTYSSNMDRHLNGIELRPGRHEIRVRLDVNLCPGSYTISAQISRPSGRCIDMVERSFDFTILRLAREDEKHFPWEVAHGYVWSQSDWEISPL